MSISTGHGGSWLAQAVREQYQCGQTDYSMPPLVRTDEHGRPIGRINGGDSVVFCCRRGEREVELTEAFTEKDFPHFQRAALDDLTFVILTLYHEKFKDLSVAFAPSHIADTLGEIVSRAGYRQLRVAESEKFAHVTFFFNGGRSSAFMGEDDCRVPSPHGVPYDQNPALSLPEVVHQVTRGLDMQYDLIVANFANGDVIGHTSSSAAKISCAEEVDALLARTLEHAAACGYVTFITADHGNLECMLQPDGTPHVAHTTNPVPFIIVDPASQKHIELKQDGSLRDIAPTILSALGLPQPPAMDGSCIPVIHSWQGNRRVLLIILDGWGIGSLDNTNPIHLADTPAWDALLKDHPNTLLQASGQFVGLQPGKAGNSEAGHMNLGAGRMVPQDDQRLDQSMKDGSFFYNEILCGAIQSAQQKGRALHLIGLLSLKSSHGSIEYPLALLKMAKKAGLRQVYLHLIFDGRSTQPGSAPALLEELERQMEAIGTGQIVTGIGRELALDRDGNYARIQSAYKSLVYGQGVYYSDVQEAAV